VVVFTVLDVLPGDPALLMLGTEAREDTLAALRSQMGLDRPAPVRYLDWVGIMLIWLFALQLGWFGAGGFPGWGAGWGGALRALVLPATALALTEAAILARVVRSAMLETMREDYVRTARAKGLSKGAVLRRHVLRNALIPVATIIGLQFGFLMAGAVVVENVFTLPGLGRLAFQAIAQRDLIVVKDVVVLLAAIVVVVNFLVDVVYAVIDPRPKQAG
ncbi:MAG TPA: ABC transporter permease, partial [Inquilinus sp.]|nr:ABC transporter permease [Inquilinus sp.]